MKKWFHIKFITIACFAASLSLVSPIIHADPGGHGHGNSGNGHGNNGQGKHGHDNDGNGHGHKENSFEDDGERNEGGKFKNKNYKGMSNVVRRFSEQDRINILNYFNANPLQATALPPGIAKNLARGKRLPPGIAKNYLPKHVLSSLPNYPGYEYLAAGNNILLVNSASKIIADILPNLLK